MSFSKNLDTFQDSHLLEKHRVESFKEWPFDDDSSCSKLKMAEAGFYWSGSKSEPDTVSCFVCNKTLDGWEKTDDPWKEHAKHAPQCQFVKYGRPQSLMTVREFLEIFSIVVRNKVQREVQNCKNILQAKATKDLEVLTSKSAEVRK